MPKYHKLLGIAGVAILLAGLFALLAGCGGHHPTPRPHGISKEPTSGQLTGPDLRKDVSGVQMFKSSADYGPPEWWVKFNIHNGSMAALDYDVTFSYLDKSGVRIGTGDENVNNVLPGQTVKDDGSAGVLEIPNSAAKVTVSDVTATPH